MILSNITGPLLGLVDTAVIGHLGQAYYLGGATIGAMVVTFITWLCNFLRMSTTGLAAQAFGQSDHTKALLILLRGILLAFVIGASCIVFQQSYLDAGLYLAGGSEQVQFYARQYGEIRIWGLPAALANLVILGWLLGNYRTKIVMWLLILTNVVNLLLDLLFVIGFGWQVQGVAWATLVAEYSGLVAGLVVIAGIFKQSIKNLVQSKRHLWQDIIEATALLNYFKLNRDIFIRTLCLEICFLFITFQGARLGDNIVAANAILMNFLLLISFALDGIANAAEAMVGQAAGAKNQHKLKKIVQVSLFWTVIFALGYTVMFALVGSTFIGWITDIDAVVKVANDYLIWIVCLPIIACWCYLYDGIYVGLMQARIMRNSMMVATFLCFFPVWFALQHLGNHGLWAAFIVFMAVRGLTLAWHLHWRVFKQ